MLSFIFSCPSSPFLNLLIFLLLFLSTYFPLILPFLSFSPLFSFFLSFHSHCCSSTLLEVVIVKGKVGTQCAVNVTGFLFGTLNTHTWIYTVYPHTDINTGLMPPCFLFAGWSQADAWRAQSQIWNRPQQREWDNVVFLNVLRWKCVSSAALKVSLPARVHVFELCHGNVLLKGAVLHLSWRSDIGNKTGGH